MEKIEEFAKLFIQKFAEEEKSEQPDEEDMEMEESEEENPYEDSENEVSEEVDEDNESTEEVDNSTEEPEKEKSLKDLLKDNPEYQKELDSIVKKRVSRVERNFNTEMSKYKELEYLTRKGLKANDIDDVLDKSREYYGKQGITYTPERTNRQNEILAKAEAKEIIDSCDSTDEIEKEIQKILVKGTNVSIEERMIAQNLTDELQSRKRLMDLSALGVKKEIYESDDFINFEKKFDKKTPIAEIYKIYNSQIKSAKKYENPGSLKTAVTKTKKTYITEQEYDKMTDEEIQENMDLIRESMTKW